MVDHSFTLQAVMEVQKLVAEVGVKTDRLIKDVEAHGGKIDSVRDQISFVKGALWVIGALVVIIGSLIGYYLSGKISVSLKP
jgi:hypothetical protein